MSAFYRFFRLILLPIQKICWPTKIVNKHYFTEDEGRAILICNYYSTPDSVIIACDLFPKYINVMIKSEVFENKIAKWFLNNIGGIPVHRGEGDLTAIKNSLSVLRRDEKLLIFPEGTRNREGTKQLAPLKPGVALCSYMGKAPIIPMLYYKKHKVFHKNYAYIGKPFYISDYYDGKPDFDDATRIVTEKMQEVRRDLDEYVEMRKHKKK